MKEAVPANFPITAMVVDTTGRSVSNIFEKHLQIYGKYTLKNSNLSLKKKSMTMSKVLKLPFGIAGIKRQAAPPKSK